MLSQLNGFFDIVEKMRPSTPPAWSRCRTRWPPCRKWHCGCATTSPASRTRREANQRQRAAVERGLFLVPKVIE
jgi:hypothetical protein